MVPKRNPSANPLVTLGDMLSLVYDGIATAQKGLLRNPSPEEERKLNRTLARLELERAELRCQGADDENVEAEREIHVRSQILQARPDFATAATGGADGIVQRI